MARKRGNNLAAQVAMVVVGAIAIVAFGVIIWNGISFSPRTSRSSYTTNSASPPRRDISEPAAITLRAAHIPWYRSNDNRTPVAVGIATCPYRRSLNAPTELKLATASVPWYRLANISVADGDASALPAGEDDPGNLAVASLPTAWRSPIIAPTKAMGRRRQISGSG